MRWRQWVTAVACEWGYARMRCCGGWANVGRLLQAKEAAARHSVDRETIDVSSVRMARKAEEELTAALAGLRAINEELATLASVHRFLAITAATGAKEVGASAHPFIGVAQRARILAARIDRAREGITVVLPPGHGFQAGLPAPLAAAKNKYPRQDR